MRIAVFGLGYVGSVSSACLAALGHEICGVDVNAVKVEQIMAGRSPIAEADLETRIAEAVSGGRLRATTDVAEAVAWADVSLVCVGTPSRPNGSLNTCYVETVVAEIGEALRYRESWHTVVIRSTLLPGTTVRSLKPILEKASGKQCGSEIGLAYNPEFLREGSAIQDFHDPPYTIIGSSDVISAQTAADVYEHLPTAIRHVGIAEAEMLKYGANAFHALKITFANEIGHFCKAVGVDSHQIMNLLTEDTKLNISPMYLKPGFAYGGSCLPKDLRAILHATRQKDLDLPLLQSLPESNAMQVQTCVDLIMAQGCRKIGILGFSFKAGTDDLRESPTLHVAETLLGKGCQVKLYDSNVNWAKLMGANRQYIESVIPHISEMMVDDPQEVIEHSDVLIIGSREFAPLLTDAFENTIVDLVRIPQFSTEWALARAGRYHGICW